MTRQWSITVPLPDKRLSPNARVHWAVLNAAKRTAKLDVLAAVRGAVKGPAPKLAKATIRRHFYLPDNRRRDADNLEASVKATIDGLREAGLLADDGIRNLTYLPSVFAVDREAPRLVIEIQEAPCSASDES